MAEVNKIVSPPFRISFPNLFTPSAMKNEDGTQGALKYSVTAIWEPSKFSEADKKKWRLILAELNKFAVQSFTKPWKELPLNIKRGLRDGEEKESMEGYGAGKKFANLTSNLRPQIIMYGSNDPIGPEHGNGDKIYPGCWMRGSVNVYAYSNKGKGIAMGLNNLQWMKDGPRLDSRTNAAADFEDDEVDSEWLEAAEDEFDDEFE